MALAKVDWERVNREQDKAISADLAMLQMRFALLAEKYKEEVGQKYIDRLLEAVIERDPVEMDVEGVEQKILATVATMVIALLDKADELGVGHEHAG